MPRRRHNLSSICVLLMSLLVARATCHAQLRPPPLGQDITNASELTPEQQAKIRAFIDALIVVLKNPNAKPEEVEAARAELQKPLGAPGVTGIFRFEFSKLLVPELESVVASNNCHTSVNALILASTLGSDRAANFLLAHVNADDQKQWQLRLLAASGCEAILKGEWLEIRTIKNAVSILRAAARQEGHPLIVRRLLASIDAADHNRLPTDLRGELRAALVETVQTVIDRIPAGAPADREALLAAVNEVLTTFRNKYIGNAVQMAERRTLGQKLGPVLGQLLSIAAAEWDAGHSNPNSQKTFGAMIGAWEGFLAQVDAHVRGGTPPASNLRAAWDAGDKAKFDADFAAWNAVLKNPPYQ